MLKALFTGRRLWMTLLVILGALVLARLGIWQLDRKAQREAINVRIDARIDAPPVALPDKPLDLDAMEYQRVELRGVFDASQEIVLRNRSLEGTPGIHVLTPLRLSGRDEAVLVDRGWLPMNFMKPEARSAYPPPTGEVAVVGAVRRPPTSGPRDQIAPAGQRLDAWFNVDIPHIQDQTGYALLPFYVEEQPTSGTATSLPQPVAITDLGPGPHLSYAIQWFAFALILLVGYVVLVRQQVQRNTTGQTKIVPRASPTAPRE